MVSDKALKKKAENKAYRQKKLTDPGWVERERIRCKEKSRLYRQDKDKISEINKKSKAKRQATKNSEVLEYARKWRKNNPDSVKRTRRSWNIKNPGLSLAKQAEYRKTPQGKLVHLNSSAKRRARIKDTDIDKDFLFKLANDTNFCEICETSLNSNNRHLDHILPLNIGGLHVKSNVRYICNKCNLSRPKDGRDILDKHKVLK